MAITIFKCIHIQAHTFKLQLLFDADVFHTNTLVTIVKVKIFIMIIIN